MFLTKSKTFIIGPVAALLGLIMNVIFNVQSAIGIANIGLCIILFTIVIYALMTPLTVQQQKFSKMSAKMNPELQAIQKKYKGKNNDQAAMAKMNEETQAVYAKYGVNPMGSCVQLIIQMPILFALYRVIWNIPAYVDKVKDAFMPLAEGLMKASGSKEFFAETAKSLAVSFPEEMTELNLVDVLYKFKPANWEALAEKFPDMTSTIDTCRKSVDHMNNFIGLNIADSPMNIALAGLKTGAILLVIGAILIPVLAALTQWLNTKLMPNMNEGSNGSDQNNSMANSMKTMNTVMPLMSAVFCLTLPVGLGIYWIAGAVVRSIQQIVINKHLDKMDVDEIMKKNLEKMNKKREKAGLPPQKMTNNATQATRNIDIPVSKSYKNELGRKAGQIPETKTDASGKRPKAGSLAEKAMMVKDFNDANSKR
ncbi:MAG: YidC/Oxa1 family membrane protein insertase [Lachnospiraceae bacterium]|nr:YidC/Oxa1 family membrane protein insertase [Lachnospiraceae bacterium]